MFRMGDVVVHTKPDCPPYHLGQNRSVCRHLWWSQGRNMLRPPRSLSMPGIFLTDTVSTAVLHFVFDRCLVNWVNCCLNKTWLAQDGHIFGDAMLIINLILYGSEFHYTLRLFRCNPICWDFCSTRISDRSRVKWNDRMLCGIWGFLMKGLS